MKKALLILSIFFIASCSKEDGPEEKTAQMDKVIFGKIYGMCGGDCRDLFLLNNTKLFKDADTLNDKYGDWVNTTFIENLDEETFNNIEDLLNVPPSLLQQNLPKETLVQAWADIDYYLYIEKDGKSKELIFDHIHKNADADTKLYFQKFLRSYKEVGGSLIDTTGIEKYY